MRCLFSPFAHPLFTTFTGIGVGLAVTLAAALGAVSWRRSVGYLLAVGAHAAWNASTLWGFSGFVGVYFVLMVPAFVGLACAGDLVAPLGAEDAHRRPVRRLRSAGLIPATDIGWLVDLKARRAGRAFAREFGGERGEQAMREYQQAAVELGFLHHRFLRGTAPKDFAERGQLYVARIGAIRPYVAFPGQVVPRR